MTQVEAVAELGLAGTPDSAEVRAAYLRLLKVRKPDQDPEGFRRLREAFELLKDGASREVRLSQTPLDQLSAARRWLADTLAEIGPAPYNAPHRANAIDRVHSFFPHDAQLTLALVNELHELNSAELSSLLNGWLMKFGDQPQSEPVWLWALKNAPDSLRPHRIDHAPEWLPLGVRLQLCLSLLVAHREPFRAATLLQRVITGATDAELDAHRDLIVRLVLEVAHGGFHQLAIDLTALVKQRLQGDDIGALVEWATLKDDVSSEAMTQVAWAWLHQRDRDVVRDYVLDAPVVVALNAALDRGTFLSKQLGGLRPGKDTPAPPAKAEPRRVDLISQIARDLAPPPPTPHDEPSPGVRIPWLFVVPVVIVILRACMNAVST